MIKIRSIQQKLFFSHTILLAAFASILGVAFYFQTISNINNNIIKTQENLTQTISEEFDLIIKDMVNASRDVLNGHTFYSKDMLDFEYASSLPSEGVSKSFFVQSPEIDEYNTMLFDYAKTSAIENVIKTICGQGRFKEIVIFDLKNNFYSGPFSLSSDEISYYLDNIQRSKYIGKIDSIPGSFVIIPTRKSDVYGKNSYTFSTLISFANPNNQLKYGYIEVEQDYRKLDTMVKAISGDRSEVYIFDEDENMIYSSEDSLNGKSEYIHVLELIQDKGYGIVKRVNPQNNEKESILYYKSPYSNCISILVLNDKIIYEKANEFRYWFFIIFVAFILISIITSLSIDKSITNPVRKLRNTIRSTNLELLAVSTECDLENSFEEISEVYMAFKELCYKLHIAVTNTLEANERELEARWLALQAQMNPHFLYNTLSVIVAVIDDGNSKTATEMCIKLSDLLKYVTRPSGVNTTLKEEFEYTMNYVQLMKLRYGEYLSYDVQIDHEALEIELPKLTLQPLVENCMNHGFQMSRPPWKIKISCKGNKSSWEIRVEDNGCGMEEEVVERIKARVSSNHMILKNESTDSDHHGMGLTNTLIRLKLMYGNSFQFDLINGSEFTVVLKKVGD